jgi:Rrf2 family protein
MLRISKKADYAVFLLGCIARQGAYPGGPAEESVVSAHEIARQAGLNKSVVANLLKEFVKHGVLESVRGLKGGYRLAREPHAVSLGEILEVVEGRFTLVDCIQSGHGATAGAAPGPAHDCSLISFCPSKNPMRVVHERICQLFRQIRLDELCCLPHAAAAAAGAARTAAPTFPIGSRR